MKAWGHRGYRVTETIEGAQPKMPNYPLLQGDLLVRRRTGVYDKVAPGLGILNFHLTPAQVATLHPVRFEIHGLTCIVEDGAR